MVHAVFKIVDKSCSVTYLGTTTLIIAPNASCLSFAAHSHMEHRLYPSVLAARIDARSKMIHDNRFRQLAHISPPVLLIAQESNFRGNQRLPRSAFVAMDDDVRTAEDGDRPGQP